MEPLSITFTTVYVLFESAQPRLKKEIAPEHQLPSFDELKSPSGSASPLGISQNRAYKVHERKYPLA